MRLSTLVLFLFVPGILWAQPPTITNFSPASGAEGAIITITGTDFSDPVTVEFFNGVTALAIVNSSTDITATVPAGAADGPISVTTLGGNVVSGSNFTVLPTPTIASYSPTSGAETATVTITGTNFGTITNLVLGGQTAPVNFSDATTITTTVPSGASTGKISFTTSGINLISATDFIVLLTPTISSFSPGSGAVGTTVTITGTNFGTITNLVLGGQTAPVNSSNSTTITTTVPSGAITGKISFTTSGVNLISATDFTVLPTPTITSFSPGSGAIGATVTITGTNFGTITNLVLGGQTAPVNSSNSTTITTTVPSGANTGKISFTTSGVNLISATDFTVLATPTITSFSPGSGAVGATVTITGTNFGTITNLILGGQTAPVNSSNSTTITTTVPSGANTGKISFTTSGVNLISATDFTVLATPTITSFSPGSGAVGATVTITGTNFGTITNLILGGQTAPVNSSNSTTITTTVPSGANTGKISFTTSGVNLISATNFSVLPTPTITGFTPGSGVIGATVTITGTNLGSISNLVIGGQPATVNSSDATTIITTVPVNASTGKISFTTSGINLISATDFTVLPTPTLTGFSPASGVEGASITITGTNFGPITNLVVGGQPTSVDFSNTTSIITTVPVNASTGKISFTTSGVNLISATNFTVLPTPTITGFSPAGGAVGATVTITGTNFSTTPASNQVTFGGVTAVVTAATSTTLTTTVPPGATTGKIEVMVSGVTVTSVPNFTVLPTPTITGFSPSSGAVGASITISGTNFSTTPSENLVSFNGTSASVIASTSSSITAVVPGGASSGQIQVTVSGVTITSVSSFTVLQSPTITSLSSASGAVGAVITITGSNFTNPASVQFSSGVSASSTLNSPTSITTTVPSGAADGVISVTTSGVTVSSASFDVLPTPTITSFSPASGAVGATVTITGTNFNTTPNNNVVTFNGIPTPVTASTANSITVTVPVGATTGNISVTVSGVTIFSASPFTILPTPTMSGFNPASGAVGATVTISGTNFSTTPSNNEVTFNGISASVSASTTNNITATVPGGATTGPIEVTVSGITISSVSVFTVLPTPTLTGFNPTSGAVGAMVTITGTNFSTTPANNTVSFNGTLAPVTASTPTSITTTVPPTATSGTISVTVSGVTVTSAATYTVLPTPTLAGFTPTSGAVGATVTITGTNFNTPPSVFFNGIQSVVTASTSTSITTTVPPGSTTGTIAITVNGVTITSGTNFTVLPTPTLTGFTPTSGAVTATVVITGTNFSTTPSNNVVTFNGTSAPVTASTSTSITTSVPPGATTGKIDVIVSGVTLVSATNFTVLPTPTITGFSPASGAVGATVIITGTNFSTTASNNVVMFNGVPAVVTASTANSVTATVPPTASTGTITVTVSGVTLTSASNFTVLPSPTITGFNPSSGAIGATVTITGTNFNVSPQVFFNGVPAVVTASNSSIITTIVPPGASTGPITVTTSNVTVASASNFTVLPTPTITSFSPSGGGVGVTVTITGTNFGPIAALSFNGTTALVTASSSTSITTTVPSGAGTGPIFVTTNGVIISSPTNFVVFGTPSITSFSPTGGPMGTVVTISGTNFSATPSENTVSFNSVVAVVTGSTPTSITTSVPFGASTGPISVAVNGITGTSSTNFTVPTPVVTSFNPTSGAVGATVTITGLNFSPTPANNGVTFNGTAAIVTASTSTTITTTVPIGASTGKIGVTVNGVTYTTASDFTVLGPPTITSFDPTGGAIGATVIISGTNFSTIPGDNVVTFFNGVSAVVTASTTTSITTTVPNGATTGKIEVTTSGVTVASASNFTVLPAPTLTGFSPTNGAVGATVTITGTNFNTTPANNVVTFNNVTAIVTASTSTSITAIVPPGATTGKIRVTTSGVTVVSGPNFTVLASPTITNFNPSGAAVTATVIISGTNFNTTPSNNTVMFNSTTASVTAATSTSLTVTVPVGATSGKISVTVSGVTILSATDFTVLPTPTLSGFTPSSGAVGASITITGTNFSTIPGNNTVTFNGVPATVSASTSTSITVTVPPGATTGKIGVTVNGISLLSVPNFTVLPTPTITGFSPTIGAVGATVTITGTNFSTTPTNNVVMFNGITAVVIAATSTSLTVTVPGGATTGPISITVSGVTIFSSTNFTVPGSPTISGFNPASGAISATVIINGTNFSTTPGNNTVMFNGTPATVTASTSTSITVTVPNGATTGAISVTVNGVTVTSAANFTVLPAPTITGFSPTSGAIGATVIITGTNFSIIPSGNTVEFNGTPAVVTTATSTSITAIVPPGASSGKIKVTTSGVTVTSGPTFTVLSTPTITSFSPNEGAVGATVTITGTGFSNTEANNIVMFNGIPAVVTSSTTTSITTSVPPGASTGLISVTVSGVTVTSATNFTVLGTPTISGFDPTSGAVTAVVTISGTNFNTTPNNNVVIFNNTTTTVTSATATSLTTFVPPGATTGKITVTTSGVTATSATNFTVLSTPTLSGFNPGNGAVGASIVISGNHFSTTPSNNVVSFNGINGVVTASTPTSITVTVPSGATTGPISITVSGVTLTSATNFTVMPTPTLTGFNPLSGAVGATVTISGTNFSATPNENTVTFNGANASVTASSSTSITAIVPNGTSTGKIAVTTSGVTVTSATDFIVLGTPAITGFTPNKEVVGALITITGINFSTTPENNVVTFNGVTAVVTEASSTSLTVIVPIGATNGKIKVTVSGVTATSATNFQVLPSLTIISFDPKVALIGDPVTIIGTDFSTNPFNNIVKFNGVDAEVISSTKSMITTSVPIGASTGKISIEVSTVIFFSVDDFIVETTPPVLTADLTAPEIQEGSNIFIAAQFSDPETDVVSASVIYKSVTSAGGTTSTPLIKSGENWEFTISASEFGELGLEYKFQATNGLGLVYESPTFSYVKIRSSTEGLVIPYNNFGNTIASYKIFSIPLNLDDSTVAAIFDELPPQSKTTWRISQYDNATDANRELTMADPIIPGLGYWLIIKNDPEQQLKTGPGVSVDVNPPFSIQLKAGWNQIGNPYNFNLVWSDLVAANSGLPNSYRAYNGAIKNFENKTILKAMEGGFINVASAMELTFPVTKNPGGRIRSDYEYLKNPIDDTDWEVEFEIKQHGISNVISGLGMRSDASEGYDSYDGFSMPMFDEFLVLNHTKELNGYSYSKDVIPTTENHTWNFNVDASSRNETTTITWDNSYFGVNQLSLLLLDVKSNVWVDMKNHNSYTFNAPGNFRVIYGDESYVNAELNNNSAKIVSAAPNPSNGPVKFHVSVPGWQEKAFVQLDLISSTGQTVTEIFRGDLSSGYQIVEWSGTTTNGSRPASGIYLIQMRCNGVVSTYRVILH